MRLEIASRKAIQYAVMNYHYSKLVAPRCYDLAFSVFNDKDEWCGVICYGRGSSPWIAHPFGMKQGQVIELVRVALNGKQEQTSKAVAISLKLVKKYAPLVEIVVSFADKGQDHMGTIYQATNWFYIGENDSSGYEWFVNGKWRHFSTVKYIEADRNDIPRRKLSGKYKYAYAINKRHNKMLKEMSLPYLKKESGESVMAARLESIQQEAFDSTSPLHIIG